MKRLTALTVVSAALIVCAVPGVAFAKTSTRLTASVSSQLEHADRAPTITGTLMTAAGTKLRHQTVGLYYNDRKTSSKRTNSAGRVTFSLRLPGFDKAGIWTLKYAGTSAYASSVSAPRMTRLHFHWQAEAAVPDFYDWDDDGIKDYVIWITLYLQGNSAYAVITSEPTVRYVYPLNSDHDLYPSEDIEMGGAFYVTRDGVYEIALVCGDDLPVDIHLVALRFRSTTGA